LGGIILLELRFISVEEGDLYIKLFLMVSANKKEEDRILVHISPSKKKRKDQKET
jgi:hypothetical protein